MPNITEDGSIELSFEVNEIDAYLNNQCADLFNAMKEVSVKYSIKFDTVIDFGAHVGFFGLRAAACGSMVICVEAYHLSFAMLCRNIINNGMDARVIPLCCAVSDTSGIVDIIGSPFFAGGNGLYGSFTNQAMCGSTMSVNILDILKKWPSKVLKMDVQGSEHLIFKSLPVGSLDYVDMMYIESHDVDNPTYYTGISSIDINAAIRKHGFIPDESYTNDAAGGLIWIRKTLVEAYELKNK